MTKMRSHAPYVHLVAICIRWPAASPSPRCNASTFLTLLTPRHPLWLVRNAKFGVNIRNLRGVGERFLIMRSRLLVLLVVTAAVGRAAPQTNGNGGTIYLKDADSYVGKAPEIPKASEASSSRPTPTPAPETNSTQTPRRTSADDPDDETKPHRDFPPAVIHRSTLTVGQQIPEIGRAHV